MKLKVREVGWEDEVDVGGEESADGFHSPGGGRPGWAATETLSATWLPPKDSRPSIPLPCLLFLLSIASLSPPFVPSLLHPPVPPACSLFLLLRSSIPFSLPPSLSWPLQTLRRPERQGEGGGGMGRDWGGTKGPDAVVQPKWLALKRSWPDS